MVLVSAHVLTVSCNRRPCKDSLVPRGVFIRHAIVKVTREGAGERGDGEMWKFRQHKRSPFEVAGVGEVGAFGLSR